MIGVIVVNLFWVEVIGFFSFVVYVGLIGKGV